MGGICLVAEKDGEIIGCIWALIGQSTQAYVGYFAIKKGHKVMGYRLMQHLEVLLKYMGIKRYMFSVFSYNTAFLNIAKKLNIKANKSMSFWRELEE